MKVAILATLASPKSLVRRQIAQILSAIASIEVPRKEWGDLIPSLCTNAKNNELNIRLASLTTLGYICDELDTKDIEDPLKNQIIGALIENISAAPDALEPTKLAIKALPNAIPYANQNFQNPQERDFIMEKIFLACESADEEVRESAINTLQEVGTLQYDSVEVYFKQICLVTAAAAKSESDKVGAQAFEFWTTLAEDEQNRIVKGLPTKNYMGMCKTDLLQLIFDGLLKINFEEDEDDDEWGHALSAACCL